MMSKMKGWLTAGALLVGGTSLATPALAQYCPQRPVLTRIELYEEVGRGQHVAIGRRQIQLMVQGIAPDRFDFEVKGFDQYGRIMPDFRFTPVLVFPGGGVLGTLEAVGGHHIRFVAGSVPVADGHVIVQDRLNPAIRTTLHFSIAAPEPEPVIVYSRSHCRSEAVVYAPAPVEHHPVGYAVPTPHVVAPVVPAYREGYRGRGHWGRREDRDERTRFSIGFGARDGNEFFRFFFGASE